MARIEVLKTYKIYIGGAFPRTESGRYYPLNDKAGKLIANICLSSRKDFRNAVVAARSAFGGWSSRAAFNRSQILYRIAEKLETRKAQFTHELVQQGSTSKAAEAEVNLAVDRLVYYAGWCDKYQQLFSSINPVATAHFNFSVPEPMGVVSIIAADESGLISLINAIAPVIAGGNTCIVLASESKPLSAISFAEVLNSSDVPGGVVNILTGKVSELHTHFANHMDVNAMVYDGDDEALTKIIQQLAALNVKRVFVHGRSKRTEVPNPYLIMDTQEIKTTWHPIENIGVSGGKY
jgi:acyl-CoA reductase-like NAD-dependent aldehyde dehydrogenase